MNGNCRLFLFSLLCILIAGCNSIKNNQGIITDDKYQLISTLLESEYGKTVPINTNLGLRFLELEPQDTSNPRITNDFKIGSEIYLALKNKSANNVWFNSQEGIEMFVIVEGQYTRINDHVGRSLAEPIILLSGYELPFVVNPIINAEQSVDIVIVVTGTIMDGDKLTDEIVGAYIECTLDA